MQSEIKYLKTMKAETGPTVDGYGAAAHGCVAMTH